MIEEGEWGQADEIEVTVKYHNGDKAQYVWVDDGVTFRRDRGWPKAQLGHFTMEVDHWPTRSLHEPATGEGGEQ